MSILEGVETPCAREVGWAKCISKKPGLNFDLRLRLLSPVNQRLWPGVKVKDDIFFFFFFFLGGGGGGGWSDSVDAFFLFSSVVRSLGLGPLRGFYMMQVIRKRSVGDSGKPRGRDW